jgi:hypothetical protein|tara:strand:+ start:111 stop:356 length:246 start_codon:yes stop_codon:yes gene_type:complete
MIRAEEWAEEAAEKGSWVAAGNLLRTAESLDEKLAALDEAAAARAPERDPAALMAEVHDVIKVLPDSAREQVFAMLSGRVH